MNVLKKIFTNRFFIIALCVAVLLSIIPAVLTAMGQGSYVRSALQTLARPFQWCFSRIGEGLRGYSGYFRTIDSLREENERLRSELDENLAKIYDAQLIEEENRFLRDYLGVRAEHSDFIFQDATVIGRESTNYATVYTLSAGTAVGIEKNMAVIDSGGLLGYVSEVGRSWSRVRAITEAGAAVGAYIERSGAHGTVKGSLETRLDGICRMTGIEESADVQKGDRVVTSGVGSFYPRGIYIGEVTEVQYDGPSRTKTALLRPAALFDEVSKVMIITGFTGESDD